jgi:phosphatidate phosphatase APP1
MSGTPFPACIIAGFANLRAAMTMRNRLLGVFILSFFMNTAWADPQSSLDRDEAVMFFPALALARAPDVVAVRIEAWVFEEESEHAMTLALTSYLGVDLAAQAPWRQVLFNERARYFRTDSERGEQILVRVGEGVHPLPLTDASGRASGEVVVGRDRVAWQDGGIGRIAYTLEAPGHPAHGLAGHAWVLPARGVFVVSDIDDTIKLSSVRDKKTLLFNTFLEPFRAVPGMAAWYREMAGQEGVFFHYLSASPLELHPALSGFLEEQRFPPGVLHLRESTSWRTLLASQEDNIAHKTAVLDRLAAAFPEREFILVGDSGESDPEIYARFARRHPDRVIAIHIRDVTGEDRNAPRYRKVFAGIAPERWLLRD